MAWFGVQPAELVAWSEVAGHHQNISAGGMDSTLVFKPSHVPTGVGGTRSLPDRARWKGAVLVVKRAGEQGNQYIGRVWTPHLPTGGQSQPLVAFPVPAVHALWSPVPPAASQAVPGRERRRNSLSSGMHWITLYCMAGTLSGQGLGASV